MKATAVLYCMLMNGGVRSPSETLMLPSRWSYAGTHHLSSAVYAPELCKRIMCRCTEVWSALLFSFPLCGGFTYKVTNTTAGPAGSLGTHRASTTGEQTGLPSSTLE